MPLADEDTATPTAGLRLGTAVLFTATIFLSATLLFFVQPLFAKLILPRIGGAPAVWTTAMLFFQTVLIAGYVYAHLMIRYVPLRAQLWVHLAFWAAALLFLPLSVNESWRFDPAGSMAVQTLVLLALGVGVPFAMLSANAPLLQAWYARSGGPSAEDPYFLYGASNLGSLIALLGFPLLAEPFFGATQIGFGWAVGFVLLGLGLGFSGCAAVRAGQPVVREAPGEASSTITARDLLTWAFIAFVPSSLMLSITTEISTDLGSFPLVWVVPLSLYILSFVVTFSQRCPSASVTRPLALAAVCVMTVLVANQSNGMAAWLKALLFAPCLFAVAVEAHRMLYNRRPAAANLTVFYITMSVGGALGGLANSIIAPAVFSGVIEGVVSVALAGALMLLGLRTVARRDMQRAIAGLIGVVVMIYAWNGLLLPLPDALVLGVGGAFIALMAFVWRAPAAVMASLAMFLTLDLVAGSKPYLFKDRSFFGTHSVRDEDGLRIYANGTTVHGIQRISEDGARPTPLSYYHPESPMAQVLTSERGRAAKRIGIVGLGVGSLACYAEPGQDWAFYEIDPLVDQVARDPSLFTFMERCAGDAPTYLGDARIVLADQSDRYDILLLDAYSSDAIPVHLVTAEALALYLDRLTEDGLLVFHISNRYYDIRQPLARIGAAAGLTMAYQDDLPDTSANPGARASRVVTMSRDPGRISTLLADTRWTALTSDGGQPWTDDFANLLSVLN